ncbi:MAG: alkaline phosphatase D [Sphingobacteriales bacterium]|jgi:alkaline phosphatase D
MKKLFTLAIIAILGVCNSFAQEQKIDHAAVDTFVFDPMLKPFYHGVASGDPLSDGVIIWTRITPEGQQETFDVQWQVSNDINFKEIIENGAIQTDATKDFTVKVDVQNLSPFTYYYYRFINENDTSLIGRTKTSPVGDQERVRFGVVSCSNFQAGFFNGYRRLAEKNDVDVILNLGDYLYEYAEGGYGYSEEVGRGHEPDHEMVTLEDYRLRYSFYRLDPDLRRAHQLFPFITVWDDHESTNDSYKDGAQNHNEGEGDWGVRKVSSAQAYHEWLPIRTPDKNNPLKIFRHLKYGNLLDLLMLDTRIWGREEQVSSTNDEEYSNPDRTILGKDQLDWFLEELESSTANWKIIGQQVMLMQFYSGPNAPFNFDAWDGYPGERAKILDFVQEKEIDNLVVLTGDIHTSWAADLNQDPFSPRNPVTQTGYDPISGDGSLGVEFVTPSITSDNFNEITGTPPGSSQGLEQSIKGYNQHIKMVELDDHGYLTLDITPEKVQAEWFTTEILTYDTNEIAMATWQVLDGENRLSSPDGPTEKPRLLPISPPETKAENTTTSAILINAPAILGVFPNPFDNQFKIQFGIQAKSVVKIALFDVLGSKVKDYGSKALNPGIYQETLTANNLKPGKYFVQIQSEFGSFTLQLIKI